MSSLSKTEKVTLKLIQIDLKYLYTILQNASKSGASYFVALLPYIGMIIHGCETWSNKVKALKPNTLRFTDDEKKYYTKLRASIKLWETSYSDLNMLLNQKYNESDNHFANCCKPIAKNLNLYDIFGAYLIDGKYCDNTILDMVFIPEFEFNHIDGEHIKSMSIIAGKFIATFGMATETPLDVNNTFTFITKDYGGFQKSPVGNAFSDKFILFSILCGINFVIYGLDKYIKPDITTKLRLAYIQYHYLLELLPQINSQLNTHFIMDDKWIDAEGVFRNCMAHYGIGVALSQDEVIETDLFGGLTNKLFGVDWLPMKNSIVNELMGISTQIEKYLGL